MAQSETGRPSYTMADPLLSQHEALHKLEPTHPSPSFEGPTQPQVSPASQAPAESFPACSPPYARTPPPFVIPFQL